MLSFTSAGEEVEHGPGVRRHRREPVVKVPGEGAEGQLEPLDRAALAIPVRWRAPRFLAPAAARYVTAETISVRGRVCAPFGRGTVVPSELAKLDSRLEPWTA